jgi:uroporphyrinogen-III synthase
MAHPLPLAGTRIAITRPAGTGAPLARRVRELGGTPLLLPGSSLRAASDPVAAAKALQVTLDSDGVIFTSPAAVRFAAQLTRLQTRARVLAPGAGTLRALHRAGCTRAVAPAREDSEGILALPALQNVQGQRIGIVGAAGGRGLLARELTARGASVGHVHVYQRVPARLGLRHADALRQSARRPLYVLLSSAEALANILAALPADARRALLDGSAVVSSRRIGEAARNAGFARVLPAASAHAGDLLTAVAQDRT